MINYNVSPELESTLTLISDRLDRIDDGIVRIGNALERIVDILDDQTPERN